MLELKEGFVYGHNFEGPTSNGLQGANIWPEDPAVADVRQAFEQLYNDTTAVATTVLSALNGAFGTSLTGDHTVSQMRVFNYLPRTERAELWERTRLGSSPHTDWYLVTIIVRDGLSRLQLVTGEPPRWADVAADDIVLLFGDYLARATSATRSAVHRVLLPETDPSTSFVFLFSPPFDAPLPPPLPRPSVPNDTATFNSFIDQGFPGELSYGEYIQRKRLGVMQN